MRTCVRICVHSFFILSFSFFWQAISGWNKLFKTSQAVSKKKDKVQSDYSNFWQIWYCMYWPRWSKLLGFFFIIICMHWRFKAKLWLVNKKGAIDVFFSLILEANTQTCLIILKNWLDHLAKCLIYIFYYSLLGWKWICRERRTRRLAQRSNGASKWG